MHGAVWALRRPGKAFSSPGIRSQRSGWSRNACSPSIHVAQVTSSAIYKVRGGATLQGTLPISGSKNSALAIITASLLSPSNTVLRNVPNLQDVHTAVSILRSLGVHVDCTMTRFHGSLVIDSSALSSAHPPDELVQQIRSSFLLVGPLLARLGASSVVSIAQPGGCPLGSRPVNLHLQVLQAMGVIVLQSDNIFTFQLPGLLKGASIHLDYPSVGATCMFLLTAAAAEGPSIMDNAACEPEVQDLACMLSCMGAHIRGAGTSRICVHPPEQLGGCEYTIMPDRIEAGTFMTAAAMTASRLTIEPVVPAHLTSVIQTLRAAGCSIHMSPMAQSNGGEATFQHHTAVVEPHSWPLQAVNVCAEPFGGFPTDLQPQFAAMMAIGSGSAVIRDTVFEGRMGYVPMLRAMGADIEHRSDCEILVHGVAKRQAGRLRGVKGLHASDLRAGAALVLAALCAEGETRITNVGQIGRGYAGMHAKLAGVGARIAMEDGGKTTFVSDTFWSEHVQATHDDAPSCSEQWEVYG